MEEASELTLKLLLTVLRLFRSLGSRRLSQQLPPCRETVTGLQIGYRKTDFAGLGGGSKRRVSERAGKAGRQTVFGEIGRGSY